jgi:hypothetical protein
MEKLASEEKKKRKKLKKKVAYLSNPVIPTGTLVVESAKDQTPHDATDKIPIPCPQVVTAVVESHEIRHSKATNFICPALKNCFYCGGAIAIMNGTEPKKCLHFLWYVTCKINLNNIRT